MTKEKDLVIRHYSHNFFFFFRCWVVNVSPSHGESKKKILRFSFGTIS